MAYTLVVGMGKTGVSVARFLVEKGEGVYGYDDWKKCNDCPPDLINNRLFSFITGNDLSCLEWNRIVECIISPGIPESHPVFVWCALKKIPIISEVELACRLIRFPLIGITGSNGKSTTVALLGHLLSHAGFSVFTGGNYGTPLLDSLSTTISFDWGVIELSSFQLERIVNARFYLAGILNLSPNHLDRHHTFWEYFQQKRNIFLNQNKNDSAVVNLTNPAWHTLLCRAVRSHIVPVVIRGCLNEGFFWQRENIEERLNGKKKTISCRNWKLPGEHNRENLVFATALARLVGVSSASIEESLATFQGLDHRIQKIAEINGVIYYDDSKSTTPASTCAAVDSLPGPIVLLMGGRGKIKDYSELTMALTTGKIKTVILFGEDRDALKEYIPIDIPTYLTVNLKEAMVLVRSLVEPGDRVLLSPTCTSWDQYENYEKRGEHFKHLIYGIE